MTTPYHQLEAIFKKLDDIEGTKAILGWDRAVMMPDGASAGRAEQLATLETIGHEILTSEKIKDLLQEAGQEKGKLSDWQQANLAEMVRIWKHRNAVSSDLAVALIRAGSECEMVWREARKTNDFKRFSGYLKKVLELVREVAAAKSAALGVSPYDALVDQFDPGLTTADIDKVFNDLKTFLPDFINQVIESQKGRPAIIPLRGVFPTNKQKELGLKCMKAIGFDFNHGRLDISHHPFCGGVPGDVRITTRYDEKDFTSALMGVLHETGHAMYENNLPSEWLVQPVGKARGMAFHESQSLLVEMQACRSWEFLKFIQPHITSAFGVEGPEWEVDNLFRMATHVERSLIRVDADEVTYPAHILLRYELEKALIAGDLQVEDLPQAWNEAMWKYVGILPDSDANGCMQDIHWTDGSFGYFPSYTLGAMIAAQLFAKAKEDQPEIPERIKKGDFSVLMQWLKSNVHGQGAKYSTQELLTRATGKPLDVNVYKQHLKNRYLT